MIDQHGSRSGEIIDGVLHTMTKPGLWHQRTTTRIGAKIGDPFDVTGA